MNTIYIISFIFISITSYELYNFFRPFSEVEKKHRDKSDIEYVKKHKLKEDTL